MEYVLFTETLEELKKHAKKTDAVLVGFSGGKDSLVCLDLCVRVFKKVVPFFMYLVPDIEICNQALEYAKERYGLPVIQYPHWLIFRLLKYGIYCDYNEKNNQEIPELKINDIHKAIVHDTGIPLVCWGAKKSDSMWRRRYFSINKFDQVCYPLKEWNKQDVFAYLRLNKIPIPDTAGVTASGIDLSTKPVLWLHDKYPEDYAKIKEIFPFVEAIVKRREFYGIK
jgi:phosphoadenosine phosphosulfate reductase